MAAIVSDRGLSIPQTLDRAVTRGQQRLLVDATQCTDEQAGEVATSVDRFTGSMRRAGTVGTSVDRLARVSGKVHRHWGKSH